MTPRDEARLRALMALAEGQPCVFCGETAGSAGVFAPYDSTEYGAAPGKARMFVYALCWRCWETTTPEQRDLLFENRRRAA